MVSQGRWLGVNGKYYPLGWGGNQFAGGRNSLLQAHKVTKFIGRKLFIINAAVGLRDGIVSYRKGDNNGIAKAGFDVGIGALGTFGGPYGIGAGGIYLMIDSTMGWGPFSTELDNRIENTSKGLPPGSGSIFHSGGGHIGPKQEP